MDIERLGSQTRPGQTENVGSEKFSAEVKELLDPTRTAVLVIDVQYAYCDPEGEVARLIGSDTKNLQRMVPDLEKFIQTARSKGMPIIWTRMVEDPELSSPNVQ